MTEPIIEQEIIMTLKQHVFDLDIEADDFEEKVGVIVEALVDRWDTSANLNAKRIVRPLEISVVQNAQGRLNPEGSTLVTDPSVEVRVSGAWEDA